MNRMAEKVALITGAGSGIGQTTAELFARQGAAVWVADLNESAGQQTVETIRGAGGEAHFVKVDVTSQESVAACIDAVIAGSGRLHVLMNNAGGSTSHDGAVTDVDLDEFWRAIKLDLFGTVLCCRHGIGALAKSGGGSVINMASVVALLGIIGRDSYTAAKGGVAALTRSMAVEFAPMNIRVNAIAPASTRTPRAMKFVENEEKVQAIVKRHLLGLCEPSDIAYAALYLASDESKRTTGQILAVDSGLTVG